MPMSAKCSSATRASSGSALRWQMYVSRCRDARRRSRFSVRMRLPEVSGNGNSSSRIAMCMKSLSCDEKLAPLRKASGSRLTGIRLIFFLSQLLHPLANHRLVAAISWFVVHTVFRQVRLLDVTALEIMAVLVPLAVAEFFRPLVTGVTEVDGHWQGATILHVVAGFADGDRTGVGLRGGGNIRHRLAQRQLRFGQAGELDRLQ